MALTLVVAGPRLVELLLLAPFAELVLLCVVDEVLDGFYLLLFLAWVQRGSSRAWPFDWWHASLEIIRRGQGLLCHRFAAKFIRYSSRISRLQLLNYLVFASSLLI